jgi:hypothetical protein
VMVSEFGKSPLDSKGGSLEEVEAIYRALRGPPTKAAASGELSTIMLALVIACAVFVVAGVAAALWSHNQLPGGPIEIFGLDPGAQPWATSALLAGGAAICGSLIWLVPMLFGKAMEWTLTSRWFRLFVGCVFMVGAGLLVVAPWLWPHEVPTAAGLICGGILFVVGIFLVEALATKA